MLLLLLLLLEDEEEDDEANLVRVSCRCGRLFWTKVGPEKTLVGSRSSSKIDEKTLHHTTKRRETCRRFMFWFDFEFGFPLDGLR